MMKQTIWVGLPIQDLSTGKGYFKKIGTFPSKEEAIAFCQEIWGADEEGRVSLINLVVVETIEEEEGE